MTPVNFYQFLACKPYVSHVNGDIGVIDYSDGSCFGARTRYHFDGHLWQVVTPVAPSGQ